MARLLRKLGWTVRTSLEEGRLRDVEDHVWSEISDAQQLSVAREHKRIFIAFDEFKGKDGAEVAAELQLHGGWIIQISRGPNQPLYRSLAKLLWHFDQWMDFFQTQQGVVILRDLRNMKTYTIEQYNQRAVTDSSRVYFDDYMARWKGRKLSPIAPKPTLTQEERSLMTPLPEGP